MSKDRKRVNWSDEKTREQPKEDVLYATIDHANEKTAGQAKKTGRRNSLDSDCDYAEVKLPAETNKKTDNSDDCADDYVLMN